VAALHALDAGWLDAAAALYARAGFVEAERVVATQWGRAVTELRLEAVL